MHFCGSVFAGNSKIASYLYALEYPHGIPCRHNVLLPKNAAPYEPHQYFDDNFDRFGFPFSQLA
jgi:hypothetical protein